MKKYLASIFAAIFVFGSVFAQPQADDVYKSLNGSVANVARYFDKVVDITINNEQSTYSKSQAEVVVRNFLTKNPSKSFNIKYKGIAASDNSLFLIGEMRTNGGASFRVSIFFKQKDKAYFLQEIKFE